MRVLRGLLVWAFASVAPSLPLGATGLSRALPPVEDKSVWHILTRAGPGTTSQCIGNLSSAWCALETYLACAARRERALCEQVATLENNFHAEYETMLFDRKSVLFYRVQWSQLGAPDGMEEPSWWYSYEPYLPPEDPLLKEAIYIELLLKECAAISGENCEPYDHPFLLAPVGDRWKMLKSGSETQVEFRSLSPDGLFPRYRIVKPPPRGGAPTLPR